MPNILLEPPVSTINRLKELSSVLDSEENLLATFFNESPDLFAVINSDGFFVRTNLSWTKLLGWSIEHLIKTPWLHLVFPEDRSKVREIVGHLVAHNIIKFHCRIRNKDQQPIPVEFSATKWVEGRSNLVGRVVSELCSRCPEASPRLQWRYHGDPDFTQNP